MAKYVTILKSSGDCLQWVKINKDFYSGDEDILLCMCYAVPLNSRVGGTCNIFECLSNDLLDFTNTFENLYVPFIAGDFNARTRDENEIVILSDDDNFTEIPIRTSSDKKPLNSSGTDLIEFCKETGFVILNGRVGKDKNVGVFTCINYNGSSVVDYMLCSASDFYLANDFVVHPSSVYSDHSLIQCTINIQKPANIPKREAVRVKKYKWDPNSKDEFIERLQDESTLEKMANLFSDAGDTPSEQSVNDLIESFTNLIQEHADPLFSHTTVITDSPRSDKTCNVNWMSDKSLNLKKEFLSCLHDFRNIKTDELRKKW